MEPQTRGHSFLGLFIQRKTWENRQLLDVVVLRVLRRQSSACYATQPTNRVSAFGGSDISCRSIHVCVCRKEQTRATDRAALATVWRSLPGVMVPCGCLCIVLSSYCQLFTRDNIPSANENLASLARPYFPTVWFTRLPHLHPSFYNRHSLFLERLYIQNHPLLTWTVHCYYREKELITLVQECMIVTVSM